jgi:hypothetical protein
MLKKVTFCLMAVLGSVSALAGHADDMALPTASGVNLMAPHQEGSWSFGVQANYFEPNYDFNYAYSIDQESSAPNTFNNNSYSVDPDYEWGWGVDVTYHFPGEGRDVTASFTQLHTSEHDSASTLSDGGSPDRFYGTGPIFAGSDVFPDLQNSFDTVSGHVDADYDAVDLTFGQLITIGDRITLHPFAGGRFADIDYKASADYTGHFLNSSPPDNVVFEEESFAGQEFKSEFRGVGPRLGSDAAVNLGSGFSLGATLGVSLLVGDMDNSFTSYFADTPSSLPASDDYQYHDFDTHNDTRVVPEADAKVNAMYHRDFNNGYGMGFEVGYQVTNYWDVIDSSQTDFYDTTDHHSNFSMQGPYARVQLDVA